MGNPSKNQNTRPNIQATKAQISPMASTPTGGSRITEPETLVIPLIKLDLTAVAKATIDQTVLLQLESSDYQVYISDQRLGTVPGSYNAALGTKSKYPGKIVELSSGFSPRVVVEVRLTRSKS